MLLGLQREDRVIWEKPREDEKGRGYRKDVRVKGCERVAAT